MCKNCPPESEKSTESSKCDKPAPKAESSSITSGIVNAASNGVLDPSQLVNMAVSAYMVNLMTNLKSSTFKPRIFLILLALVCLQDIRSVLSDIIQGTRKNIPKLIITMFNYFFEMLKTVQPTRLLNILSKSIGKTLLIFNPVRYITFPSRAKPTVDTQMMMAMNVEPLDRTVIEIKVDPNVYLMSAIHKYCQLRELGKHNTSFELTIQSITNQLYSLDYENIVLNFRRRRRELVDGVVVDVDEGGPELSGQLMNRVHVRYDSEDNVKEFTIDQSQATKFCELYRWEDYLWFVCMNNNISSMRSGVLKILKQYEDRQLKDEWTGLYDLAVHPDFINRYKTMPIYQDYSRYRDSDDRPDFFKTLLCCQLELIAGYIAKNKTDYYTRQVVIHELIFLICLTEMFYQQYSNHNYYIGFEGGRLYITISDTRIISREMSPLNGYEYSVLKLRDRKYGIDRNFNIENYFQPKARVESRLTFKLSGPKTVTPKQLYDSFVAFTHDEILLSTAKKQTNLIAVYTINFTKTEKIISIPNPVFSEWQEQVDSLKQLMAPPPTPTIDDSPSKDSTPDSKSSDSKSGDSKSSDSKSGDGKSGDAKSSDHKLVKTPPPPATGRPDNLALAGDFGMFGGGYGGYGYGQNPFQMVSTSLMKLLARRPPANLRKVQTDYQLDCRPINKVYKRLETLYIREMDKIILTNMVDKFKNKRDLYNDLGIPYKLGMLFHGRPGTGKTSAIKAVASYLGKDIFFVHLKHVKTNKDLKAVFEHINDKCNGGVIVLEDIDAATDIVFRRDLHLEGTQAQPTGLTDPIGKTSCSNNNTVKTKTKAKAKGKTKSKGASVVAICDAETLSSCSSSDEKERDKVDEEKTMNLTDCLEEDNDKLTLSYLLNLLDGTLCNDGTIFAITTNHLEKLDPALYRKGRVDVTIEFKLCDHYQISEIFKAILGRPLPEEILERIPEDKYAPCDVIFHIYQYLLNSFVSDEVVMQPFMSI